MPTEDEIRSAIGDAPTAIDGVPDKHGNTVNLTMADARTIISGVYEALVTGGMLTPDPAAGSSEP